MQALGDKCDCVCGLKHMSPDQGRDGHVGGMKEQRVSC